MSKVAINGFGRMGRLALRAGWDRDGIEFVHVNEPAGGSQTSAHLLTFDSVHGRWDRGAHGSESTLTIDDTVLAFTAESDPVRSPGAGTARTWCSSARGSSGRSRHYSRTSTMASGR